tara:strand:+ start:259 stop:366 length:108 start_codon:yes stop_codon:yes gene_type:complete
MDKIKEQLSQFKDWFARKQKQFLDWLFSWQNGTKK